MITNRPVKIEGCVACLQFILYFTYPSKTNHVFDFFYFACLLQSAGGEWKGICRGGLQPVSQPILSFHLTMWNNFSHCPGLISLCGNLSLVPNCGARRAQPEHTSEKKGNNWNCPLPYTCPYLCLLLSLCCCY